MAASATCTAVTGGVQPEAAWDSAKPEVEELLNRRRGADRPLRRDGRVKGDVMRAGCGRLPGADPNPGRLPRPWELHLFAC
ncbi:hypothetical protein GCM10009679_66120 [Saccharothrix algeriensis]|uniref:Uncharacterized protein n=1 Tax=Catellatospora bangladeshensis TaxID=310355 RepID=A0A8J3NPG8_9ACTN|nr:hypothetical protein Cba03nite_72740 [Catellatospora bangladeshensis]